MRTLFVAWIIVWGTHLYYSQKYLYRSHDERPSLFSTIRKSLWFAQLILAIALIGDLFTNSGSWYLEAMILLTALAATLVNKRAAYTRAVRVLQRSLSKQRMPVAHAGIVAKMLMDLRPE